MAKSLSNSTALDERCSLVHIAKLSENIEHCMGGTGTITVHEAEEQEIRGSHTLYKMLWKWVRKLGDRAR